MGALSTLWIYATNTSGSGGKVYYPPPAGTVNDGKDYYLPAYGNPGGSSKTLGYSSTYSYIQNRSYKNAIPLNGNFEGNTAPSVDFFDKYGSPKYLGSENGVWYSTDWTRAQFLDYIRKTYGTDFRDNLAAQYGLDDVTVYGSVHNEVQEVAQEYFGIGTDEQGIIPEIVDDVGDGVEIGIDLSSLVKPALIIGGGYLLYQAISNRRKGR